MVPAKRRAESAGTQPPKRANPQLLQQSRNGADDAPGGELSIKGADSAEHQARSVQSDALVGLSIKGAASRAVPAKEGAGSLLDRIHSSSNNNGDSASRRGRRRTKT